MRATKVTTPAKQTLIPSYFLPTTAYLLQCEIMVRSRTKLNVAQCFKRFSTYASLHNS